MQITNQQQADAIAAHLESITKMRDANLCVPADCQSAEQLEKDLAEWKARGEFDGIELIEDDKNILRVMAQEGNGGQLYSCSFTNSAEYMSAVKHLKSFLTDKGRRYAESLKEVKQETRNLRWQVHSNVSHHLVPSFRGAFSDHAWAEDFAKMMNKNYGLGKDYYEVREAKC